MIGRKIILEVVERVLEEVNYYNLIKKAVQLKDSLLKIMDKTFNLKEFEKIYLIAGGKSSSYMAKAFEEILGEKISEGIVVEKRGYHSINLTLPIVYAGHPLPDEESVRGGEKIVQLAKKACEKDLVIVCVSGGWTSLTTRPPNSLPLKDVIETYKLLLFSGMPLNQMNIVRNRLSMLGKGKILDYVDGATVIGIIAVDEVGGKAWGPTVVDDSSFKDALNVIENYGLLDKIPVTVKNYLLDNVQKESYKDRRNSIKHVSLQNFVLVNNIDLCNIALKHAKNYAPSYVLTTSIEGEAKDVGTVISAIAKEISLYKRPFSPPCILIAGGETTVTIGKECGEGGRNQELALSTALNISGTNIVLAAVATDGTDGPTDFAGAIVDGQTFSRSLEYGIDLFKELKFHNSSYVFKVLEDAIYTGETGTNLMDLILVYIQ
ncbi:MAG: glycerate kinase type-2 family protein [Nitrososphaeria archaeon]